MSGAIFYTGFSIGKQTVEPSVAEIPTHPISTEIASTTAELSEFITFKGLDTSRRILPPLPTPTEWDEVLRTSGIFENRYKEDVIKYGDIAKRYHSIEDENNPSIHVVVADVTGDGQSEQVISLSGGGSYGVDTYEIVQGEEVIAVIDSNSVGVGASFEPNKSGDGFEMIWFRDDMFPGGYCCPAAQMVTQFIYQDGSFKAVSETVELLSE